MAPPNARAKLPCATAIGPSRSAPRPVPWHPTRAAKPGRCFGDDAVGLLSFQQTNPSKYWLEIPYSIIFSSKSHSIVRTSKIFLMAEYLESHGKWDSNPNHNKCFVLYHPNKTTQYITRICPTNQNKSRQGSSKLPKNHQPQKTSK